MYSIEIINRFFNKVDKQLDCWIWTASTRSGYGAFKVFGKTQSAHRISWEVHNNRSVPEGKLVCHKCNNKLCVNPEHLYIGTYSDNSKDAVQAGVRNSYKYACGEKAGTAKLTQANILKIVKLHEQGLSHKEIAKKFKVGTCTIGNILRGESWKHINRKVFKHFTKKKTKNPKLSTEDVLIIRQLAKEGISFTQLADKFNVNYSTIRDIVYFKTWKYVA